MQTAVDWQLGDPTALALDDNVFELAFAMLGESRITDDMIGLPNPPDDLPPASRLGWYFGGYLSTMLSPGDCKRMVAVAKGIARGMILVEMAPAVLLLP